MVTQKYINDIAYKIVGCAIEVHKNLGPGLLESVYHSCLLEELESAGLTPKSQFKVPLKYKGKDLENTLMIDILVNDLIVIELKSIETILPIHKAQLLTYLKLTDLPKGLLINFNSEKIVDQLVPMVTEEFAILPKE